MSPWLRSKEGCSISSRWSSNESMIEKAKVTSEIMILFWVKPNYTFFYYTITDFSKDQMFQVFKSDNWDIKINFMVTYSSDSYYIGGNFIDKLEGGYRDAAYRAFFYK